MAYSPAAPRMAAPAIHFPAFILSSSPIRPLFLYEFLQSQCLLNASLYLQFSQGKGQNRIHFPGNDLKSTSALQIKRESRSKYS